MAEEGTVLIACDPEFDMVLKLHAGRYEISEYFAHL